MTPASRAPPHPPFPAALSEPVCTSREPSRPRCGPETSPGEAVGKPGQAGGPLPGEGHGGEGGRRGWIPVPQEPGALKSRVRAGDTPMQGELEPEA